MAVKHEEIAQELRQAIKSGEYSPGSTIPALPELMRRYNVARNTVRDAIGALTQEGLVTPMQGVGTVVRDTTPILLTLREEHTSPTWPGYDQLVRADWGTFDPEVTNRLGTDDYLYRLRHQWQGEQVAQIHEQWVPRDVVEAVRAAGITLDDPQNPPGTDIFTAMTQAGREPSWLTETVVSRIPDPEESKTMAIPPGVPVILVQRVTVDAGSSPLETSLFTGSADRISHAYQVPYKKVPTSDRHAV